MTNVNVTSMIILAIVIALAIILANWLSARITI